MGMGVLAGRLPPPPKNASSEKRSRSQEKLLIRNRIHHRMVDPMKLAPILPIAGSVVRAADDKCPSPLFFPSLKEMSQLPIYMAQGRFMAL
jgi:hypothetical protein